MSKLTLGQAIKNSVQAELNAAAFYKKLQTSEVPAETLRFLAEMEKQELEHAEVIEKMGKRLLAGELPQNADAMVDAIEQPPDWDENKKLTLREAMEIAYMAERHAEMFYGILARMLEGELSEFFARLSHFEKGHAELIDTKILKSL